MTEPGLPRTEPDWTETLDFTETTELIPKQQLMYKGAKN